MAQNSPVSRGSASPPCERQIRLPFVSGNALIYGIHMVTLPRPQPPQIPQACWRLRLEPGGGGTSARHTLFPRSLAQGPGARRRGRDPGAPCVSHLVGLELPLQSHPGETARRRLLCPPSVTGRLVQPAWERSEGWYLVKPGSVLVNPLGWAMGGGVEEGSGGRDWL